MGTMTIVCCGPDSCVQREKERSVMLYEQVKRRTAGCGALLPMSMWIDKILPREIDLLSLPLLTPVVSRHVLLYQSLPTRIQHRHDQFRRRKEAPGVGTAERSMT